MSSKIQLEHKAGALGSIAGAEVKRAAPDGYTVLFTTSGAMSVNRVLIKDLAYDTDKDFQLVSAMPTGELPSRGPTKKWPPAHWAMGRWSGGQSQSPLGEGAGKSWQSERCSYRQAAWVEVR
ncbi:tripartite tricarboxylate transporter substrate-binding protein [Bradyrhizobium sp. URHA0013]|uniref:tripartite tricarboxylate transporter substrate-binding protein n=1 Tax=Bradyrhizobium sp. URHA0013 TaxID=1380352 RepID=UPI003528B3D8